MFSDRNIVVLLLVLLIISCGTNLYIPTVDNVTAGATLDELAEGRKLYVEKCGSCHLLYNPNSYEREQWKIEVDEMQERTKIDDHKKELILKYLWNSPG